MASNNDHKIKEKNLLNFIREDLYNDPYDEPTYLTFRVNFFPNNSSKPLSINDIKSLKNNNTSLMSYNDLPEPFLQFSNEVNHIKPETYYDESLGSEITTYNNAPSKTYSTYDYLKESLGDKERANLLKEFITQLLKLTWDFPYYIKSIEGLNELLSVDIKRGSRLKKDTVLTLKCYESLDQRISTLKTLYKKIVWDDTFQRWVLPDMMRFFKMDIYISEFRIFHEFNGKKTYNEIKNGGYNQKKESNLDVVKTIKNTLNSVGKLLGSEKTLAQNPWVLVNNAINNAIPTIKIECRMCEFDISNMFSHFSQIISSNPKEKRLDDIEIKIKVGNINEINYNGLIQVQTEDSSKRKLFIDDNYLSINQLYFNDYNNKQLNNFEKSIYTDRTGIYFDKDNLYPQPTAMFDDSKPSRTMSYLGKAIKDTFKGALDYADNLAEKELNKLLNTTMGNSGLSFNDVLGAVTSANINTMYNTFKTKAESYNEKFPEISKATKQDIKLKTFETFIKNVSNSEDDINSIIAKTLLDWGKSNATSIDDYINVISEATQLSDKEKKFFNDFINKFNDISNNKKEFITNFAKNATDNFSTATNENNTIDTKIIL